MLSLRAPPTSSARSMQLRDSIRKRPAVRWRRAALVLALLACAARGLTGCARPSAAVPRARNVLLVTLDTTRRDALSCYGGRPGLTPTLDALAASGILCTNAHTVAPLTRPAHSSMFTGLYPPQHRVHLNGLQTLPSAAVTVAELARDAGLETAAFVGAVVLDKSFGMAQGFETFDALPLAGGSVDGEHDARTADEVNAAVRAWLSTRDRARPFLAWIHYFDPHRPYAPPAQDFERAGGNTYLGEVAYVDRCLGEVLALLREQGLYEDTLIAVVADHGEALGQHGEETHGDLAYEPTLAVPLLLRLPRDERAGSRIDASVSVTDLFPTLLEGLDLAAPGSLPSRSLLGPLDAERGVYFEALHGYQTFRWSQIVGWVDARGKYIHSAEPEYYELASDPGETRNLAAERRTEVERARRALEGVFAPPALPLDDSDALDEALLAPLARLGYTGSGRNLATEWTAHPLDTQDRPAPAACMARFEQLFMAQNMLRAGNAVGARQLIERVLAIETRNPHAHLQLSSALLQLGQPGRALEAAGEALRWGEDGQVLRRNLGRAQRALGNLEQAALELRKALAFGPGNGELWIELAEVEAARGASAEAAEARRKGAAAAIPAPAAR